MKSPDPSLDTLNSAREMRLLRILPVEEMDIEIVDTFPTPEVLKRGSLAQDCSNQTLTIRLVKVRILAEESLLFGLRQHRK